MAVRDVVAHLIQTQLVTAAVIDRLPHYSTTVNIRGESYRLKDKRRAGVFTVPTARLPG
jgi:DNA replication protein DnaC